MISVYFKCIRIKKKYIKEITRLCRPIEYGSINGKSIIASKCIEINCFLNLNQHNTENNIQFSSFIRLNFLCGEQRI